MRALASASVAQFLLLFAIGAAGALPASALTTTFTVPFDPAWQSGGWGCGDFLPKLRNGMFTTSFNGNLPAGSSVKNVNIIMPMRRGGLYSATGDADPVVTLSVAGQQIAGPAVVPNYYECPYVTDLVPYTFDQAFPTGFAAYDVTGSNSLMLSVQGGTCPSYCGVTVTSPVVTIELTYDPPPPAELPSPAKVARRIVEC